MQYELYIDIFFLVNFMMDYLVLLIMSRFFKCKVIQFKVILSAIVSTLVSILIIVVKIPEGIKQMLLQFGGSFIMLKIAFGFKGRRLIQGWCILYFTGILMGGIFFLVSQYVGKSITSISIFVGIAVATYFLTKQILECMEAHWKNMRRKYTVTLQIGTERIEFVALRDTGNMLTDNTSGNGIHIIGAKAIKKFSREIPVLKYVCYQTIQGESKVMPLIRGDKMYIHGKKEQLIENPYIAVAECMDFGNGDYEIILHPDCIQEV